MTQQEILAKFWTMPKTRKLLPVVSENASAVITSNVRLRRVNRITGKETIEYARKHNTITNVALLCDLFCGISGDHLSSGANIRIQDSGGGLIKTIGTQRAGFPTAAAGTSITLGWEDLTTDAYNPDDLFMETVGGVIIAEALNVSFSNKLAIENWFFDWDISISSNDVLFDDAGFDAMLDCITGAQSAHFDGTGSGAANMRIRVYDANTGGTLLVTEIVSEELTQPTTTSVRWRFLVAAGSGSGVWRRVQLENNAPSTTLLYNDTDIDRSKPADTQFIYQATITLADS